MTLLYLIRHAEAEGNASGRFLGQQDVPLTPCGRHQAARLARALAAAPLVAVYTSDLERAVTTARRLAAVRRLSVQLLPALREVNFGSWTGCTYAEIAAGWPEAAAAWIADPERVAPPGGESLADVRRRATAALEEIARRHGDGTVAVVTHGGVIGALLAGWSGGEAWLAPLANTGRILVRRSPEGWQVDGTEARRPGRYAQFLDRRG
ncbi:MAG: histidine phosphatase family protein [Symbiobacteriia bacterium]